MNNKEKTFDDLLNEALENAIEDRAVSKESFNKMKAVFDINIDDPSTMQGAMLIGANATKLLENLTRSNEQIIKLAQLKQKDKPKNEEKIKPINLEELLKSAADSDN